MSRRHPGVLGAVVSALALAVALPASPLATAAPAGGATASLDLGRAAAFIKSKQQNDGGFEVAGFPGFETPDAILALGEAAQTGAVWNSALARASVAATVHNGKSPLDYVDDLAETTTSAGQAAKLIVLVAAPLGIPAAAFNPQGDAPADLVAKMDAGRNANGSYGAPGAFNATLYAAIAQPLIGRTVSAATRDYILGAQQANGGWGFAGDPTGTDIDIDTTGLTLQALAAAGVDPRSDGPSKAVAFLKTNQLPSGGWPAFGTEDANATSVAILGLTAVGQRVDTCWAPAGNVLPAAQATDGRVASPNDSFGVNTFATSQAVQAAARHWLPVLGRPVYCPDDGYRMVASDGGVFAVRAPYFGSAGGMKLNRPMVGIAASPGGQGYWLVASDGGVFAFGDARFAGSAGALHLNQPVVGMAATPSGRGYWLVARDGGVFAYGDAGFFGSAGSLALNQPVVGMAATPSGRGYWLVARDGGVFAYGDATYLGSTGGTHLNKPVVGIGAAPSGKGYWLVSADAGVFAFGDARFVGSSAAAQAGTLAGVVGIRTGTRADAYVYADADGRAVAQGSGDTAASDRLRLNAPIVGITG